MQVEKRGSSTDVVFVGAGALDRVGVLVRTGAAERVVAPVAVGFGGLTAEPAMLATVGCDEVSSGWAGQAVRMRAIASRSAAVTHSRYLAFTDTCRAT